MSNAAEAERLRELGADDVIIYGDLQDRDQRARQLSGDRGVDRMVDIGGTGPIERFLRAVAAGVSLPWSTFSALIAPASTPNDCSPAAR